MARRTMEDYKNLLNHLESIGLETLAKFGVGSLEELLRKYSLEKIYDKLQKERIKKLNIGEFVGVEIDEEYAKSSNVTYDIYMDLDYTDVMDIKYGHIIEHLPKQRAYKVLAVGGYKGADNFVVLKLDYDQIKILFNEEYEEFRYDLMKYMRGLSSKVEEKEAEE